MTTLRSPLWQSIAGTLAAEIAEGQYQIGDKLPTEAQMAARFGVNRHTVRVALSQLSAQGLVRARRGAGVFMAARPTDYPLGRRVRYHQNIAASGRTPSRQINRLEIHRADAREAAALNLPEGVLVHVFEGLSLADGVPLGVFRSVFPVQRFPGLAAALAAESSVTRALAREGLADYTRASTRITAKTARGTLAVQLHLLEGAPILRVISVNVDTEGVPVEYGHSWFAGERVTLTLSPEDGSDHQPL